MTLDRLRDFCGFHDTQLDAIHIDHLNNELRLDIGEFFAWFIADGENHYPDDAKGSVVFTSFFDLKIITLDNPGRQEDHRDLGFIKVEHVGGCYMFSLWASPNTNLSGKALGFIINEPPDSPRVPSRKA